MAHKAEYHHLVVRRDPPVLTVVLNRPEVLNACDARTHREIQSALLAFDDDAELRVAVLTGAGRAFCAGSDVRYTAGLDEKGLRDYVRLDFQTKNLVASVGKPVIAATRGHVVGGGLELALACDLRIAHSDSVFSFGEVRLGTIPGAGGPQRLREVVGLGIATEWVLSGRPVRADEALQRGLVNRTVSTGDVADVAAVWANELAAADPVALALAKVALRPQPALDNFARTFHELASVACHRTGTFDAQTAGFQAR